jgi:hydrogenase maturation protein HypF
VQFITPVSTQRRHIHVRGTVQGVGFRPFVHQLAARHSLAGWVFNHAGGVEIEVEGTPDALEAFLAGLRSEAHPWRAWKPWM